MRLALSVFCSIADIESELYRGFDRWKLEGDVKLGVTGISPIRIDRIEKRLSGLFPRSQRAQLPNRVDSPVAVDNKNHLVIGPSQFPKMANDFLDVFYRRKSFVEDFGCSGWVDH